MRNRNIPFGYQYENGSVTVELTELEILQRIVQDYLKGLSLLKIAELLNAEQIEYQPGVIGWNKARIKHILEDERYLGENGYPAVIDTDTFAAVQLKKNRKNNQKETNRQADIFRVTVPVRCPECGAEMRRRRDNRSLCIERWVCQNKECHTTIKISDDKFLGQITEHLNQLIQNPELIENRSQTPSEPSAELRKLENEIGRTLDAVSFDGEVLRKKMMECVSLKYKNISDIEHITEKVKADFEKSSPLSAFSPDLFGRTVKEIHLRKDQTVDITLINGQRFRKE